MLFQMLVKRTVVVFLLCVLTGSAYCWANDAANNVYQGTIPVQNRDETHTFRRALKQVLIKVSGNPKVATVPSIQQTLNHPKQLVNSYQVIEDPDSGKQSLKVAFAQSSINRVLSGNGQTLWIGQRPDIIACIAVKMGNDMFEEFRDNDYLNEQISRAARHRGLTLVSPMTQFESSSMLKASDIWQFNMTVMEKARRSMTVDSTSPLLAGALTKLGDGQWRALWVLKDQGETFQWHYDKQDLTTIVKNTFDRVLSHLADHYSVLDSNHLSKMITVNVHGLQAMRDLNEMKQSIAHMKLVNKVNVKQLRENRATMMINITGSVKQFVDRAAQTEHFQASRWHPDTETVELEWVR